MQKSARCLAHSRSSVDDSSCYRLCVLGQATSLLETLVTMLLSGPNKPYITQLNACYAATQAPTTEPRLWQQAVLSLSMERKKVSELCGELTEYGVFIS